MSFTASSAVAVAVGVRDQRHLFEHAAELALGVASVVVLREGAELLHVRSAVGGRRSVVHLRQPALHVDRLQHEIERHRRVEVPGGGQLLEQTRELREPFLRASADVREGVGLGERRRERDPPRFGEGAQARRGWSPPRPASAC